MHVLDRWPPVRSTERDDWRSIHAPRCSWMHTCYTPDCHVLEIGLIHSSFTQCRATRAMALWNRHRARSHPSTVLGNPNRRLRNSNDFQAIYTHLSNHWLQSTSPPNSKDAPVLSAVTVQLVGRREMTAGPKVAFRLLFDCYIRERHQTQSSHPFATAHSPSFRPLSISIVADHPDQNLLLSPRRPAAYGACEIPR